MADAEDRLQLLDGGVGMFLDVGVKFLRVELTPTPPACFGSQRPRLLGVQIAVNSAAAEIKTAGSLDFGAARLDEVHHAFSQIQCIGFHAHKPITLCANVNMTLL